jgi:cytochrome c biogenesis protein CcdA
MPNRSATKTRARANPPPRIHPRASNRALARAKVRRAVLRRRLLRAAGVLLTAVLLYLGGAGTGVLVMKNRMESRMAALMHASTTGPTGVTAQDQVDLQRWAREQGLPEGLPDEALTMLHQQYPDEVPQDVRQQLIERLGGG